MSKADERTDVSTDSKNKSAVEAFYELVNLYKGKEKGHDTNFVFFVGAGFSKAWDENFPGGKDLFEEFSNESRLFDDSLECYLQTMSWCKQKILNKDKFNINFDDFKKIVFSLDMYEKYKELKPKYIDSNGLKMIKENLNALIALEMRRYNPYLQELHDPTTCPPEENRYIIYPPEKITEKQGEIINFFSILRNTKNNNSQARTKKQKANSLNMLIGPNYNDSQGQERIRLNHITTNYDSVIECISDACINEVGGESHLDFVYRGFTPDEYSGFSGIRKIKNYSLTESLFKLNGGLEIYRNSDGTYKIDYGKKECKDLRKESPLLILPSYEQDYSNPYFREILQKSKELLTMAKVLIIVGYSLPKEDILIRFLLKHFALDKVDFQDKTIFYINKGESHNKLIKKLKSVFREAINRPLPKQVCTFSGSFNEFVKQFNQRWGQAENTKHRR
jgi:hypothetical protein